MAYRLLDNGNACSDRSLRSPARVAMGSFVSGSAQPTATLFNTRGDSSLQPGAIPLFSSHLFLLCCSLAILGAVPVLRAFPSIPQPLLGIALSGFFLFAVLRVTPPYIYALGYYYQADPETHILGLPRAGNLRVEPESAKIYEQLIPLIQEHAGAGEIYAAPDCPQIYFLTGYRNPTRALFDFLEDDYGDSEHILRLVDSRPIHVIVLSKHPSFSAALPVDAYKALVMRFREGKDIGDFEVRWRD